MSTDLGTLSIAAVTVGFVHCVSGPDHYVPFVAMSRVGLWSFRKTMLVTLLCGIGHVAGSALLGFIGIALGLIVFQLESDEHLVSRLTSAESVRGELAAWLFVAFGLAYFIWGVVYAIRSTRLTNGRAAADGSNQKMLENAATTLRPGKLTPWILFTIFLFGPCEPLIPLLMYPAAKANVWNVLWVTALFGVTTLVTMTTIVALIYLGTITVRLQRAEVYGHALAGLVVLACGLAIMWGL